MILILLRIIIYWRQMNLHTHLIPHKTVFKLNLMEFGVKKNFKHNKNGINFMEHRVFINKITI